ncbi:MAG: hypothetical protein H0V10_12900 [Geodermatophilaceae bacterium]|nr:hypothetical protein [Geodermatophilaceae bacterium]
MSGEMDGSVRIAWEADGFVGVRVVAARRPASELAEYARRVADAALFNRTTQTLRSALRHEFGGAFDFDTGVGRGDWRDGHLVVTFHPPRGTPNHQI